MKYKYIFWDFNGTIADDVDTALNCVNDMLSRKGRQSITKADYYNYIDTPIIKFYYHILSPEEINFDEISREFHSDYLKRAEEIKLADGACELLERLNREGARQYVVTANNLQEALYFLNELNVAKYMDKIVGAEDSLVDSKVERGKNLIDSLNIDKSKALFVGDTLHDIEAAQGMGIDYVLVSYGHQGKRLLDEHNAYNVESLKDVEKIIFSE